MAAMTVFTTVRSRSHRTRAIASRPRAATRPALARAAGAGFFSSSARQRGRRKRFADDDGAAARRAAVPRPRASRASPRPIRGTRRALAPRAPRSIAARLERATTDAPEPSNLPSIDPSSIHSSIAHPTRNKQALSSKVSPGLKARVAPKASSKASGAVCMAFDNKKAAAIALAAVIATAPVFPAKADLTSDLLARSEANKELNDKKRALTSSANFERSRTVTDGVCEFPKNFFGCEIASSNGGVAFLSDDKDIECEGTRDGKVCASKAPGSFPPVFGL